MKSNRIINKTCTETKLSERERESKSQGWCCSCRCYVSNELFSFHFSLLTCIASNEMDYFCIVISDMINFLLFLSLALCVSWAYVNLSSCCSPVRLHFKMPFSSQHFILFYFWFLPDDTAFGSTHFAIAFALKPSPRIGKKINRFSVRALDDWTYWIERIILK